MLWDPLRDALGDGGATIAFDNPGVGSSSAPRLPLRLPALARVVARLLDELGHHDINLLGWSFGGGIAQEVARRFPTRINRLILAGTAPGLGGAPGKLRSVSKMATPRRYYDKDYLYRVAPLCTRSYGGKAGRNLDALAKQVEAQTSSPPTIRSYYQQLVAGLGWSLPWLHRIRVPTLVLAGDDDSITPVANARTLARHIPEAQLKVFEGAGHMFPADSADEDAPVIRRFLDAPDVR